jgi:hypothetical protein
MTTMRRWLIGIALGLLLLTWGSPAIGQHTTEPARQAGWLTDYAAARALARSSGKPLFLVFRCQP